MASVGPLEAWWSKWASTSWRRRQGAAELGQFLQDGGDASS
jgi:hypothetical protein